MTWMQFQGNFQKPITSRRENVDAGYIRRKCWESLNAQEVPVPPYIGGVRINDHITLQSKENNIGI